MQQQVIAIIRIESKNLDNCTEDEERFERAELQKISLRIPRVKALIGHGYKKEKYEDRPLLLNYGFVVIPLSYARDREMLHKIVGLSDVIHSFVLISERALKAEKEDLEEDGLGAFAPILVEQVTSKEWARLEAMSHNIGTYTGIDGLTIGSIILLQGYPFANMSAQIIAKSDTQFRAVLLDTGYEVTLKPSQIYYKNS